MLPPPATKACCPVLDNRGESHATCWNIPLGICASRISVTTGIALHDWN